MVIVNVVVIVIVNGIVIVIVGAMFVGVMFVGMDAVVVVINLAIVVAEVLASGYTSKGLSMYHNRCENVTRSTIIINFITNILVIIVISFV